MSNDYTLYNNAKEAINNLISNKEKEIEELENIIYKLKKVRRMIDEEFRNKLNDKENYIG